jgi:hypothetical protein
MKDEPRKSQDPSREKQRAAAPAAGARVASSPQGQTPPGSVDRAPPEAGGEDEPKETQPGGKDAPPDT